jgi:hypothetical protein
MFLIMKMSCTFNVPLEIAGLKATTYSVAEATEMSGAQLQDRDYLVMKMDNGDKAYARTQDVGSMKEGGAFTDEGTWSIIGGTGKLKGIKGKGTYKGSGVAGGTEDTQMEGEYSLSEATTTPKKK